MPSFRIHRLKDHLRQNFRFAPHLAGMAGVKPRDYESPGPDQQDDIVEASSPYAAFFALREARRPIQVGDLLECEDGSLKIFKFVGIEDARWVLPEARPEMATPQPEAVAASA
ncbi:MAG TPA: hypothetical protein VMT15_18890 [Bryobacteraceae bacterium]|nr:hypothetical protein [Bryobacteraceae bacterium]